MNLMNDFIENWTSPNFWMIEILPASASTRNTKVRVLAAAHGIRDALLRRGELHARPLVRVAQRDELQQRALARRREEHEDDVAARQRERRDGGGPVAVEPVVVVAFGEQSIEKTRADACTLKTKTAVVVIVVMFRTRKGIRSGFPS